MDQDYLKKLKETFASFQDKRVVLYGTGVIAHSLVAALEGFQIVGCLDRYKVEGDIEGVPIITWDDIADKSIDTLIIAAAPGNYREIYERIMYRCISLHIEIYSGRGENLKDRYSFLPVRPETANYYLKNETELKKAIEEHDAVSFDLFDTLVMRKTLEPADIFDIVEERLREKGIIIPQFRKKRQAADHRTPNGNIYQIYETLGNMLGLDQTITETILKEEIQCEKDFLIPRTVMAELLRYAVSLGKTVDILSDMYLPAPILEDILSGLGIGGYRSIYVSCDYGTGKTKQLFPIYLKSVCGLRCLHIGDSMADIEPAVRYGIDAYYIKSAYEMLKISNLRGMLAYEGGKYDRLWIGLLISELFNDPFALYHSSGVVTVTDVKMLAKLFIAPIVLVYMQKLYDVLKMKDYDGILFGARDGYLFKKIYDEGVVEPASVPSVYLLISRKLAFKTTMQTEQDIIKLEKYIQMGRTFKTESEEKLKIRSTFCDIFGEQSSADLEGQHSLNFDFIIAESQKTRSNYLEYLKSEGIDLNKRYLFCDLVSGGTCHQAVNRIFDNVQEGFFLSHLIYWDLPEDTKIPYQSVYSEQEWYEFYGADLIFAEMIITAPTPLVCDMSEEGTPIYDLDHRGPAALRMLNEAQDGIIDFICQYRKICRGAISKKMASDLLDMVQNASFKEEADIRKLIGIRDDVVGKTINFKS